MTVAVAFAKTGPQYNRIAKANPRLAALNAMIPNARAPAEKFVNSLKSLKLTEQKQVAEGLIKTILVQLDKVDKAYDPEQPRAPAGSPDGGQWTAGAVAGAAARGVGRAGLAVAGFTLRSLQDVLSTFTLIPSSKSSVSAALKQWFSDVTSKNRNVRLDAFASAYGRTFNTLALGFIAFLLATHFVPAMVGSVGTAIGTAVGQALKTVTP